MTAHAHPRSSPGEASLTPAHAHQEEAAAALTLALRQLSDSLHADFGLACRDLETGAGFFFNDTMMMHAASTMKVPVMIEVFRQMEAGRFRWEDSLLVRNEFASIVDGSPYSLDLSEDSDEAIYGMIGKRATIAQLVEAMITVSSNLATNLLMDLVGPANLQRTLAGLGLRHMQVLRGVEDLKAYRLGLNNRTDARDLMLTLEAIAREQAASPASCQTMINILKAQKFRDKIPAGLPPEVEVGNKTGSITAIAHDAALLFPPGRRPCVMVILTRGIADQTLASQTIARLARQLYDLLVRTPLTPTSARP